MLLTRAIIAGFASLAWMGIASAATDGSKNIEACLRAQGATARGCVGRVSGPCIDKPEGKSTVGMVECISTETEAWDNILNAEYGRLLPLLKAEAAEDVKKAQRLWVQGRDADCKVPYNFYDGGTIVQTLGAECVLNHTAGRAILINSWREMAQGE
jgi:uncharacterized protein YecT (DUF1311 family)